MTPTHLLCHILITRMMLAHSIRPVWSHAKDCRSANPSSRIVKLVKVTDQ